MRRLFPLLLILSTAACTSAGEAGPTPAAPPPTSAPAVSGAASAPAAAPGKSGDQALSKDTKAICAQADRLTTQFGATFIQDLKQLIDSSSAKDQQRQAEVEQKTQRDVQNFSFALRDLSALAADGDVKKALAGMSKDVTALNGDVRKLDADKLGQLSGKLDKACGRA
jgi:hypothetical protein